MIFYDTAELLKVCQYRFRKSKRIPSSAIDEPLFFNPVFIFQGLPDSTVVKNLLANAGGARDMGSIPGSGRSPGVGSGNLLQYSCLENSTGRGAWWAAVCQIMKRSTWLSTHKHSYFTWLCLVRIALAIQHRMLDTSSAYRYLCLCGCWQVEMLLCSTIKDNVCSEFLVGSLD